LHLHFPSAALPALETVEPYSLTGHRTAVQIECDGQVKRSGSAGIQSVPSNLMSGLTSEKTEYAVMLAKVTTSNKSSLAACPAL
jgi:hypothetical protein